ncbi:MAG TPA: GGDEF domain-containing protein [Gammaproteobacteria bacterium]|nr:GGDEF domain-containing protein [Gammaproteobacteria bacterium]
MANALEHRLRRFTVAKRIAIIVGLLLLPMAALSVVSVIVLNHQELSFRESVQESIDTLLPLTTLENYLERAEVDELEAQTDTPVPNFATLTRNIDNTFSNIETSGQPQDLPQGLISAARRAWQAARPSVQRLIKRVQPLAVPSGTQSELRSQKDLRLAIGDVSRARRHLATIVRARYSHAAAMRHSELIWLASGWAVTLTIATLFVILFLYSILAPVKRLERAALRLGSGKTDVHVPTLGNDEFTDVAERFNDMAAYWRETRQALVTENALDPLTGVLNRRGISEALEAELAAHQHRHRPLSVFVMDLDRFKDINDTFGHSAGDRALVWVTEKMRESLRNDDHLGRYGGDEFVAVLPNASHERATVIAQRLEQAIRQAASREQGYPTLTVGVASAPEDGWAVGELIARADERLYGAKQRRPHIARGE